MPITQTPPSLAAGLHPRLAELIASRLCHDLISPMAAINNGVEFVTDMSSGMSDDAMALIGRSASQASVKLELYRAAYGASGGRRSLQELQDLAHPYFEEGRIKLEWSDTLICPSLEDRDGGGKLVLLAVLTLAEALPRGGVLKVQAGTNNAIDIIAMGEPVKLRDGVAEALAGRTELQNLDARLVLPYFLAQVAGSGAGQATLDAEGESILRMTITAPGA